MQQLSENNAGSGSRDSAQGVGEMVPQGIWVSLMRGAAPLCLLSSKVLYGTTDDKGNACSSFGRPHTSPTTLHASNMSATQAVASLRDVLTTHGFYVASLRCSLLFRDHRRLRMLFPPAKGVYITLC